MASNEKLFNKELFISILRNVGWLAILYQILLFVAVLVPFVQQNEINKGAHTLDVHSSIFQASPAFQTFILVFIPVILGIFLFSYLMKERTSVFTHSMPFSRKSLYLHHTLSGIVMLIVPIMITAFLTMLVVSNSTLPSSVIENYVFSEWAIVACAAALGMFSLSTLAAMVSGNFVSQGAVAFGILLVPYFAYSGIVDTIERLFYGFQFRPIYIPSVQEAIYKLSIVAIVISIVIFILAYFVYLRRDIANTSESIVFRRLKPVIKYVFTITALFATAMYIANYAITVAQFFIFLMIGTFIGYVIAELIIKKSRLSFKNFIGFFVVAGVCTMTFGGLCYLSDRYEAVVPDVSGISSISITPYYTHEVIDDDLEAALYETLTFTEEESFEEITRIHEKIVFLEPEVFSPYNFPDVKITYTLENGDHVSRSYSTYTTNIGGTQNITVFQELLSMPELTNNVCAFLDDTVRNNVEYIGIYDESIYADNNESFNDFIDALILDIQTVGLQSSLFVQSFTKTSSVDYTLHFDDYTVTSDFLCITEDYVNTIKWLEGNGYDDVLFHLEPVE